MTIRARLTLSYLAILVLLGINLIFYFWSDSRRQSSFEELRRAIQAAMASDTFGQRKEDPAN